MSADNNSGIRQWVYNISLVAAGLIPLLVGYHTFSSEQGSAWSNLLAILGTIAAGGSATAATVLSKQRKTNTLDFTGTAPEQAIAAIQATVAQAKSAANDLDKVRGVIAQAATASTGPLNDVLGSAIRHAEAAVAKNVTAATEDCPVVGPLVTQLLNSVNQGR